MRLSLPAYRSIGICAFLAGAVFIASLAGSCYRIMEAQQVSEGWVRHSYIVVDAANQVLSTLRAVLASSRGYLITPTPRFSELYEQTNRELDQRLAELRTLTVDNTKQMAALAELSASGRRVQATVAATLLHAHAHAEEAVAFQPEVAALVSRSCDDMDAFRALHVRFVDAEQLTLEQRLHVANDQLASAKRWAVATGIGSVLTFLAALLVVERQFHLRSRLERSLESRIDARTRDLATANHDLEQFSYMIAHDLKAPLRAIEGFTTLAAKRLADGRPHEAMGYFGKMQHQSARSAQLVTDLLTFAQLGRGALTQVPVDLGRLFQVVWEELDIEREQRSSRATIQVKPGLPVVLGEESLLHQVLFNLLSNAIKYSVSTEHPVVVCGWRLEVPPDLRGPIPTPAGRGEPEAVFFVRDNGIGFSMDQYPRLFAVFQRLHADHSDGSGIGLAICKRIIERHGGCIWASSAVGVGTEMCFTLPVAPARRSARQAVSHAPSDERAELHHGA